MGLVVQASSDLFALLDGLAAPASASAGGGDAFTTLLSSIMGQSAATDGGSASADDNPPTGNVELPVSVEEEPGKRAANDWAAAAALAFAPAPVLVTPTASVEGGTRDGAPQTTATAATEPDVATGSRQAGDAPLAVQVAGIATTGTNGNATAPSHQPAASQASFETDGGAPTEAEIPIDWVPQPQTSPEAPASELPASDPEYFTTAAWSDQGSSGAVAQTLSRPISTLSAWETTPDTPPSEAPAHTAPPPNTENAATPTPAEAIVPADDPAPAGPAPQGPPPSETEFAASPTRTLDASAGGIVPTLEARPPRTRGRTNVEHQLADRERANAVRGLTVAESATQTAGVVRSAGNTEAANDTAPAVATSATPVQIQPESAARAFPPASPVARQRVAETPAAPHSAVTAGTPASRGIEPAAAAATEAPAAPAPAQTELPPAVHQVSRAVIERAELGGGEARLHLDPAGLGEVTIHVETVGNDVHVDIHAEMPEAMSLLREHAVDLSNLLGERGLNLADVSVDSQERQAAGESLFQQERRNRRDDGNFAALLGVEESPSTERHNRLRSAYNPDGAHSYRV